MIISLDTETTGKDFAHGAMPFLVTVCVKDGEDTSILFWEWPVDPLTRVPEVDVGDCEEICQILADADLIYMQNGKFDAHALATIGVDLPWSKVRDCLAMGHLLASNHRHDLTSMCVEYLGVDIEKHERLIEGITRTCRMVAKREFPEWVLAKEGLPSMPSIKDSSDRDEDKPWKNDMWLPRALALQYDLQGHPIEDQDWFTACSKYANADSEHTLFLGLEMEKLIRERGYWKVYEACLELPQIAYEMEAYGLTARGDYTASTIQEYEEHSVRIEEELHCIAKEYGHDLELAEGAALNDNMRQFFYGTHVLKCPACKFVKNVKHWNGEGEVRDLLKQCPKCSSRKRNPAQVDLTVIQRKNLDLPVVISPKTGNATLDAEAMRQYSATCEGAALDFVQLLVDKRDHDTAHGYMQQYRRYWVPVEEYPGYYRIHAWLNPFATDHLRWSSNSPNLQNVSTGDDEGDLSLRWCFGPLPGRVWYKMDYENLEARIPAYKCKEPKLIELYEKPNEPPYWGSLHNLTASLLFPQEYEPTAHIKGKFKEQNPRRYKKCKNTNFAKQYGAGKRKVALTSGVQDAYDRMDRGLPLLAAYQAEVLAFAERHGYVETLPDRTVDPTRGYPILASRTDDGRVLSTTPFNYCISGTACWVKNRALGKCRRQLEEWREEDRFDGHIALEVHDEILFDFPQGDNDWRAEILQAHMESCGDDVGIPTPVSVSYHEESWAKETVAQAG